MKNIFLLLSFIVVLSAEEMIIPLSGIIKPIYEGKIGISTEGKLEKIYLKEGDVVKKRSSNFIS
jgi:multidrug efflux pump subunit AcrA (membrane-fusion protein)